MTEINDRVACRECELVQVLTATNLCRRCHHPLARPIATTQQPERHTLTLRQVMQMACVDAVAYHGQTTLAASALGVGHARLKQLLREAGHEHGRDRRYKGETQ